MTIPPESDPEPERLRAVRRTRSADDPWLREALDDLAFLATRICDTPMGAVTLIEEDRQLFVGTAGVEVTETPRDDAFCAHTILGDEVLVVPDARRDRRFAESRLVTGEPGVRFYAGAPITTSEDLRIGAVCVMDAEPREITSEQEEALQVLTRRALALLEVRRETDEAYAAREAAEAGLRAALDVIPVPLVVSRWSDGVILFCNEPFARLLGMSITELQGREKPSFYDDPERRADLLAALEEEGEVSGRVVRFRRPGGQDFWAAVALRAVRFEGTEALLTALHDLTAQIESANALSRSQQRYEALFDAVPDGILIVDREGRTLMANARVEEMFGYTPGELVGRPVESLIPPALAEAHVHHRERFLADPRARTMGFRGSLRGRRRDGTEFPVGVSLAPMDTPDGVQIIATVRDLTEQARREEELRRSESRLREALRVAGMGWWEYDLATGRMEQSPEARELYGDVWEERGATPEQWLERIHPEDRPAIRERMERSMRTGVPFEAEYRILHPERGIRHLLTRARLVPPSMGRGERFLGIDYDITHLKEMEAQFLQAQKQEAVGQLAGGLAHDFNNLLTVIRAEADLLLQARPGDPELAEMVSEIQAASERGAALVRQLLAFSRRQILRPTLVDLNRALRSMEGMLRRTLGERIRIEIRLEPGLARIRMDPNQLEQLVLNLALNARDAMPEGGTLLLETDDVELDDAYVAHHLESTPGPHVRLTVSDTGTGMSPEVLERIFEPFFSTKPAGQGTGLGLASVYGIVKQSGGNIWCYSEPGKGTTFKIYFPAAEGEVEVERVPTKTGLRDTHGTETILLVEDDTAIRRVVIRVLEGAGYRVLAAGTGAEARKAVEEHRGPIHLLLTDVGLPDGSGVKLAEELAAERPEARILYISGYTENGIVAAGELEEDLHFLPKPFNVEDLLRAVRAVLDE